MTSQVLANPRRTSLAGMLGGASLGTCSGSDDVVGAGCRNVAVHVVNTPQGPRQQCRSCSRR